MNTNNKADIILEHLKVFCVCFSTGRFESLYPLLSEDCVYESQWVLTPNVGKACIVEYLDGKGEAIRKNDCLPECTVVELVGNLNKIKNADIHLSSGERVTASVGLYYKNGSYAVLMEQKVNYKTNTAIVLFEHNENDLISRIDICMPELFNYKEFDGPFYRIDGEIINGDGLEKLVAQVLTPEDESMESRVEEFVDAHYFDFPGDLDDYVFRVAIRIGNKEYVDNHAPDFDLNDGGDCSTYLYETEDEDMQALLIDHGAYRSFDDYGDYRFAAETVNGTVLCFEEEFQIEVYEKYKETFCFTDEDLKAYLKGDSDIDDKDRCIEDDLESLGVSFEDGEPVFADKCGDDAEAISSLLEELGWELDFEGDSWTLETNGVYYIE